MKKFIAISSVALVITVLVGIYSYAYQEYLCNGTIETNVRYIRTPLNDEKSKEKISFSFSWNALTKELDLSDIDELSMPARHIDFYNMDKSNQKGMLSSKGKTLTFYYSADPQKDQVRNTFNHESSSLDFDKISKFIVIDINTTHEDKLITSYTKKTVRAQCERYWF